MSLWKTPEYPGAPVRYLRLKRNNRVGFISISLHGDFALIMHALPDVECKPEWRATSYAADEVFERFVAAAYETGWQNWTGAENG